MLEWVHKLMCTRFGPSKFMDFTTSLMKWTQSTVQKYQAEFEWLYARSTIINEVSLTSCLVEGLKPKIRHMVQIFKPAKLAVAIELARLREDELPSHCINKRLLTSRLLPPTTSPTLTSNKPTSMSIKKSAPALAWKGPMLQLWWAFKSGHHCNIRMLFLLDAEHWMT